MLKLISLLYIVVAVYSLPRTSIPEQNLPIDPNGDWRVVGGSDAPSGAYPFIVSVRSSAGTHFCGGSVLSTLHILTAAHCAIGRTTDNTAILAGTNTLNSGGVTRLISNFIIHAYYNSETIANDIAIITLSSALSLSGDIRLIGLNTGDTGAVAAILVGWGRTGTNDAIPNNLQHLNTNTITHAQCQESWSSLVSTSQICAVTTAGQGACPGDSGGPLLQSSNRALLGIVSFIRAGGCAQGFPDVYARVSSYINWIISSVNS